MIRILIRWPFTWATLGVGALAGVLIETVLSRVWPFDSYVIGHAEVAMAVLTPDDPDLPKEGQS